MRDDQDQRRFSALTPLRFVGRGIGAAALGFGRMVRRGKELRHSRRNRAHALASISAAMLPEGNVHTSNEKWVPWNHNSFQFPFSILMDNRGARDTFQSFGEPNSFPLIHKITTQEQETPQALLTVGSRRWGNWWDGRGLLKIKIYDFAIYVDGQKAHDSLSRGCSRPFRLRRKFRKTDTHDIANEIGQHVPMSIMVRASRNIPVDKLNQEYEKILERRICKVGGTPQDPALREMLSWLTEGALPRHALDGGAVRAGAALTFERLPGGELRARVGGKEIGRVRSDKLCSALFDLYLGEQPVSSKAKDAAGDTLRRLRADPSEMYQPSAAERIHCGAAQHGLDACVIRMA